jgi:hypothetical protein
MGDGFLSRAGAPRDARIALVAQRAGVPRAVAVAVWWWVLDAACQDPDRGSVRGADPEVIAVDLDLGEAQVRAVLSAIEDRGMTADGRVAGWDRCEAAPARARSSSADRMRRHRARRASDDASAWSGVAHATDVRSRASHVTSRASHVTSPPSPPLAPPLSPPDPQTPPPVIPPSPDGRERARSVGMECLRRIGRGDDPTVTWAPVHQWLADGCDPERDVYPTIDRILASGRQPRHLGYFTAAVTEAMRRRTAAGEAAVPAGDGAAVWRTRVGGWVRHGLWPTDAGPPPDDPATRVPADVLAEHGITAVKAERRA